MNIFRFLAQKYTYYFFPSPEHTTTGYPITKSPASRTLAPERGCISSPIPLRGVRILAERFYFIGRNFL